MAKTEAGVSEVPFRIVPAVSDRNKHFWQGGRGGELRFQKCNGCGYFIHPPSVICPKCWSKDIAIATVSGRAEVLTFSVNVQNWMPGLEPPFVLAIVGLVEQDDLRLTTNIVNIDPYEVTIGMPVQVVFEPHPDDEVWIPLFEPARER
ncbi:MAG: OB-fold domain-containing protein [Acidimicrobiia bacterium]